jgi:hypothetical protein
LAVITPPVRFTSLAVRVKVEVPALMLNPELKVFAPVSISTGLLLVVMIPLTVRFVWAWRYSPPVRVLAPRLATDTTRGFPLAPTLPAWGKATVPAPAMATWVAPEVTVMFPPLEKVRVLPVPRVRVLAAKETGLVAPSMVRL